MIISNTATNSLAGTSYAQPTTASQGTSTSLSSSRTDSVHLSATAEATGYKQQGLSISQIASLMGVTSQAVDSYLQITTATPAGGGGGAAPSAPAKSSGGSSTAAAGSSSPASTTESSKTTVATTNKITTATKTSNPVTTNVATAAAKLKAA